MFWLNSVVTECSVIKIWEYKHWYTVRVIYNIVVRNQYTSIENTTLFHCCLYCNPGNLY